MDEQFLFLHKLKLDINRARYPNSQDFFNLKGVKRALLKVQYQYINNSKVELTRD